MQVSTLTRIITLIPQANSMSFTYVIDNIDILINRMSEKELNKIIKNLLDSEKNYTNSANFLTVLNSKIYDSQNSNYEKYTKLYRIENEFKKNLKNKIKNEIACNSTQLNIDENYFDFLTKELGTLEKNTADNEKVNSINSLLENYYEVYRSTYVSIPPINFNIWQGIKKVMNFISQGISPSEVAARAFVYIKTFKIDFFNGKASCPISTLIRPDADCDDVSALYYSFLRNAGIPENNIFLIHTKNNDPQKKGHAFLIFKENNCYYSMDQYKMVKNTNPFTLISSMLNNNKTLTDVSFHIVNPELYLQRYLPTDKWYKQKDISITELTRIIGH